MQIIPVSPSYLELCHVLILQSLTWAVSKGNTAAVRTLVNAGADPNMKHCDGGIALDLTDSDEVM